MRRSVLHTILIVVSVCGAPSAAPEDNSDLFSALGERIDAHHLDSRSARSADFDKWLRHYLSGSDAEAAVDWTKTVKTISKPEDLHALMKEGLLRINFSAGNVNNPRRRGANVVASMILTSETALGKDNMLLCSGYDFAAYICKNSGDLSEAIVFKKKELQLRERYFPNSQKVCNSLIDLAYWLAQNGQISEARNTANHVQVMVSKGKDANLLSSLSKLQDRLKAAPGK